eukprot:1187134-Prorocentrum_minimum.AAC.4
MAVSMSISMSISITIGMPISMSNSMTRFAPRFPTAAQRAPQCRFKPPSGDGFDPLLHDSTPFRRRFRTLPAQFNPPPAPSDHTSGGCFDHPSGARRDCYRFDFSSGGGVAPRAAGVALREGGGDGHALVPPPDAYRVLL